MGLGWLLNREVVLGLAVLGAVLAMAASSLEPCLGPRRAMLVNRAGYGLTFASIALFILAGFVGTA